jgi:hypothetical protein
MYDDSVSVQSIKRKIETLDEEIKESELAIVRKKEVRSHLSYLLDNFHKIFPQNTNDSSNSNVPLFPEITYSPSLDTKSLIVEILRKESRRMKWQEIYEIFHAVKPDIAESTLRVSLSQINKDPSYPVKLVREKEDYWYEIER